MKALSIHPPYAMEIALGLKPIEYRSWDTSYRGPLLICSTKAHGEPGTLPGHAVCIVNLVSTHKYGEYDYGWELKDPRPIEPVPVSGRQRIFNVDFEEKDLNICPKSGSNRRSWMNKYFYPKIPGAKKRYGIF